MIKTIHRKTNNILSKIAYRWAPIHYQHVNLDNPKRDMLCAVNFDGNWNTKNNQRNMKKFDLIPVVYYSVAETKTHYFILYSFYHADDFSHHNDLEGCLIIVQKKKNILLGMITVAHHDFFSYSIKGQLKGKLETIDGKLLTENYNRKDHPMTKQEQDKHGLFAWKSKQKWKPWTRDKTTSTGIRYIPKNKAQKIDENKIDSFEETECEYVLVDMLGSEGFWRRRNDVSLFERWGTFNAGYGSLGNAHAPWVWNDSDDKISSGMLFYDPAAIVYNYFKGFDSFDHSYTRTMNF